MSHNMFQLFLTVYAWEKENSAATHFHFWAISIDNSSISSFLKKISPQKVEKRLSYGPIIDSAALHGVLQYCRAYVCFVD